MLARMLPAGPNADPRYLRLALLLTLAAALWPALRSLSDLRPFSAVTPVYARGACSCPKPLLTTCDAPTPAALRPRR